MHGPFLLLWWLALLVGLTVFLGAATACSVRSQPAPLEHVVPYACDTDSDCTTGRCLSDFGICTQDPAQLTTFLFEVTPQASDPVYGGARFLIRKDLRLEDLMAAEERGIPPGWLELNVRPRVPVRGSVLGPPDQEACASRGGSTVPVTLTFSPREGLFGLSVPAYELDTVLDTSLDPPEYVFRGALPPGRYDVYIRPDVSALGPDCRAIPQIIRNLSIGEFTDDGDETRAFTLEQSPPASLRLTIPWQDKLEGWWLDMVHPVTGEVISNRIQLRASDVVPPETNLVTTLYYSLAQPAGSDFIGDGDEIVRFTPPPDFPAGTVLFQRFGIEIVVKGEATVSDISTFGTPVDYQAWVWKGGVEYEKPVPGTVSFAAVQLDQEEMGVPTEFVREARVDANGSVSASLLPGKYRVRVTPPGAEVAGLGLMAGYESLVTVWPNGTDPTPQRGHLISVPPAVSLSGTVLSESAGTAPGEGGDTPLFGVEIRASASSPDPDDCFQLSEDACKLQRLPVLRKAQAGEPFMPRTRTGLSQGNGSFRVEGLDCGQCTPGAGARFDVSVRPAPESGLAWRVLSSINVYEPKALGPIRFPVPVAQPARVTYADPATSGEARALPGALIRVFALIDNEFGLVSELEGVLACKALPGADGERCIQSLLQVAELRSGPNGDLLLLLPPSID